MKLMNTACLAALLLTCPLAATAVHGADPAYNSHEVTTIDNETGIVASSDLKEQVPQGTYYRVYFGRAYNYDVTTSVESSNNEGTLGTGLTVTGYQVYGGWVKSTSAATVKAKGNKVILKNGVSLTKGPEIYGGYATGFSNTEASDNTVIIGTYEEGAATQEGFKGTVKYARGGAATSESAISENTSASNNTVTINEGFENSVQMRITVGSAGSMLSNAEGVYKASENKLYITNPAKLTLGNVYIGYIFVQGKAECTANNNYTDLQLNENVEFTSYLKSFAQSKGNVEASDNKVYIQGGKLGYTGSFSFSGGEVQSVAGGENTTAKANGNTVKLTDVERTPYEFNVGHAINNATENENNGTGKCITQANNNTLILNGGTYSGSFYVGCAVASSGTVTANENSIELRKGTDDLSPDLTNASLIVAYSSIYSGGTGTVTSPTGNTLKFYDVKDMHAKAISGFQKLNYEYSEMHVDDVILTVTDSSTSIANTDVNVSVGNLYGENDGEFQIGDKVVLLKSEKGIEGNDFTTSTTITAQTGISLRYEVDILLNDDRTELILTRTGTKPEETDPDSGKTDGDGDGDGDHSGDSGKPDGDSGKTDGDSGKTDGDSGKTDGDSGKTDGDSGKTDGDSGKTDGDSGKTDGDSGKTDGDSGKTDGDSGKTDGDSGKTDGDSGKTDGDSGKTDDADSGKTDGDSGKTDDADSGKTDDADSDKTDDDSAKTDTDTDKNKHNGDTEVLPGTKAIAEGAAAGLALVNESSNAAIELLRDFSLNPGTVTPFVHVQASSMRHQTGSSINLSSVSLVAGLGTGINTGAGNLSLGAFFEYGKGSYTTHNSFDSRSDVDGDGNSWYMGGGILAKMDFVHTGPGHFYVEGSAHMGSLHNEYDSNDLRDANGNVAKFDMDSPYYSLHGGLGYVWNMAEGHDLDVYGKYIWTRVQGTDDTLTTKDKFEYDDMDSNRVRFGVRYSYNGSERFKPYVGVAYEHEFAGSCESTVYGHPVAAPSFEGSSGMGELGLMTKPSEDLPLSINLGVQGYVGQKRGVSGNCNVMYEF